MIHAVIIEPPENQYILEGAVATLSCRVQGAQYAFWSINEENTTEHRHHWSYYEGLGVVFTNSSDSNSNINLTMTVPASLTSKVNNIRCIAKNENHFILAMSDNVQISVFKSFSKSAFHDVIIHGSLTI